MGLIAAIVNRTTDAVAGDSIKVFNDGSGRAIQAMALTDTDGNHAGTVDNPIAVAEDETTLAMELNNKKDPLYVGKAAPGTAKASTGWQIRKFTYVANQLTDIQWADGDSDFDNIWDDRASYSYS